MEILDVRNVAQPYKVLGVVQVNAGKFHSSEADLRHLRDQACGMGADAMIDLEGPGGGRVGPHLRVVWSAKAIVWVQSGGGQ